MIAAARTSGRAMRNQPILRCGPISASSTTNKTMTLMSRAWATGDMSVTLLRIGHLVFADVAEPAVTGGCSASERGANSGMHPGPASHASWHERSYRVLHPDLSPCSDAAVPARL